MIFFAFNNIYFSFTISYTSNALIDMVDILFREKKCPKMCLKINSSVKTPWQRPSTGVARSGLWAPVATILVQMLYH